MNPQQNYNPNYHKSESRLITMKQGKIPPQAIDLECAILGALMIDKKADEMFDVFTNPDVFYKESHRVIFEAILSLSAKGEPIDLLTVSMELKAQGNLDKAGGDIYLIQLTQAISSSAHIDYHSKIVMQKYIARQMIKNASESIEMAYDETIDVFDLMDHSEMGFTNLTEVLNTGKKTLSWGQMLDKAVQNVGLLTAHGDKILGIPTGFWKLDAHFGGWQDKDLIIIAARPGAGKTAFTVKAMIAAAQEGKPVGYFSLEMSGVQLATRGIAVESHFHLNQLTRTGFEKDEYFKGLIDVVTDMKKLPIHIDDAPALTLMELRRKARRMVRQHGIKVLFLDYLQLAAGGDKDVRFKITELSYGLKALAKELEIPVIALSQLSREVDKRSPPRPRLSDIAESAAIEAAADVIGFIYRPGYYDLDPDYSVLSENENTEFIVAKNRNGGTGTVGLWYEANKTKFSDEAPEQHNAGGNNDWEQTAQSRTGLPTPSANEAFGNDGGNGWSIEDKSNNDTPF